MTELGVRAGQGSAPLRHPLTGLGNAYVDGGVGGVEPRAITTTGWPEGMIVLWEALAAYAASARAEEHPIRRWPKAIITP